MPANYVLLEKITVGAAGASSVTFSGIPQTGYTDLVVKVSARDDVASSRGAFYMTFNGSSASNYSWRELRDVDGTASSTSGSAGTFIDAGRTVGSTSTASTFNNVEIYIPNYTSSTAKSANIDNVLENNSSTYYSNLTAGLWSLTNAITSIGFTCSGNFVQYSTFYLYGVAKLNTTPAIAPKATGGNTIMTDGTYWYHAFLSSGTFTPATALSCDVLVIAGGGAGGSGSAANWGGGGGGAGGVYYSTSNSVATAQTVTVGAGGATVTNNTGANGSNSVFGSLTAAVGGGGGGKSTGTSPTSNGSSGGSGGGGGYLTGAAGTAISGQGFAGGLGSNYSGTGAGGGGAGAVGAAGAISPNDIPGNGGIGVSTYSSWGSATATGENSSGTYYYAGGGGGGNYSNASAATIPDTNGYGGLGGGGRGNYGSTRPTVGSGTANTGGGGGGSYVGTASGAGGSGLVIVRYPV